MGKYGSEESLSIAVRRNSLKKKQRKIWGIRQGTGAGAAAGSRDREATAGTVQRAMAGYLQRHGDRTGADGSGWTGEGRY